MIIDTSTEKAIRIPFVPSLTAQTALSLLTLETQAKLKNSNREEIKTLLDSLRVLSNTQQNISKNNYFIKFRKRNI